MAINFKYYGVELGNSGREYTFKTLVSYKEGELVMCDTRNGVLVGTVVDEYDENYVKSMVSVPINSIRAILCSKREWDYERMSYLTQKMERVKQGVTFEEIAKTNTEMRELLVEYNHLRERY